MIDRLKKASQAMITRKHEMEIVANNLANVNTNGFKKDSIFLHELDKKLKELQVGKVEGEKGILVSGTSIDFSQGALKGTGQVLDVAISGDGLFVLEAPQGEVFTRDGRFTVNADGILTNLSGSPVLGEGGQIEIDMQENTPEQIIINNEGEVVVDGQIVDKLKLVSIDSPFAFTKIGSNMYELKPGFAAPSEVENSSVRQGYLEESNVNGINEMVKMIEIFHFYQTSQKMISSEDRILSKAVNDIARVN